MNEPAEPSAYIRLEASQELTTYGRVVVLLGDTLGKRSDTLYQDTLRSLSQLRNLAADGYQGGPALITIHGYRNQVLVYSETRLYDGQKQKVLSLNIAKNLPIIPIGTPAVPIIPDQPTSNTPLAKTPSISEFPRDTTVSIKDSVLLNAEVIDPDGDLAAFAWECTGDTIPEDSASLIGFRGRILSGIKFAKPGHYSCKLRVYDKGGRQIQSATSIKVVYDAPRADAGQDTTVVVSTKILLHARGFDGYGPIVTMAWNIAARGFVELLQGESSMTAPNTVGDLTCILRAMDSDSLIAYDTLIVHIIPDALDTMNTMSKPPSSPF